MPDIKITELPSTSVLNETDQIIVEQADGTKRAEIGILPAGVPDGGTQGQVLTKLSSADDDADWEDIPSDATKMDLVSSPTNGHLLTTNTSGQAVDSGVSVADVQTDVKCLVLTSSSFSSLPQTITNANITSDHVVVNSVLSNPSAQADDWTVTTSNGSLSISGSISGSTTITLYLMRGA